MSSTIRRDTALGHRSIPGALTDGVDRHASLSRIARLATVVAVIVAALVVAGIVGLSLYAYSHDGRIYEGVRVGDVSVGGMSRDEAATAVQQRYEAYATVPLSVVAAGEVFTVTPQEAGATFDQRSTVNAAFGYGREGSFWERSSDWARGLLRGLSLSPRISIEEELLDRVLSQIAVEIDRSPSEAFVDMETTGGPTLVADVAGQQLDRNASHAALASQVRQLASGTLTLPIEVVPASVAAADLTPGLPGAQAAVSAPFVLTSAEGSWTIPVETLRSLVSVDTAGVVAVDEAALRTFVSNVAAEVDRPSTNTRIAIGEDSSLSIVPGSYSAIVDQATTAARLRDVLLAGEHSTTLLIERTAPEITDAEASLGVAAAEALVRDGIDLEWDDGNARLERADLVRALVIDPRPGDEEAFSVSIDADLLAEILFPITAEIDIPVQDASFRLVNGTVTLVSKEKGGRATDSAESVATIIAALDDDERSVELTVVDVDPEVRANELDSIVVPDILGDSFTYYGNSSEPRRQNVERAVDLEAGWLVPPGGVFSYVEHIGDIDEESGFATGFGIVADEEEGGVTTAPVIGGGICQVSTTIFQAAFWSGLSIEERWQHPYWLTSYGQPPRGMKGLDAMVNVEDDWALDMKFRNTTDNWIAVVVVYDGQNVTAQILGTDPGWEVSVSEPVLSNVVPKDEKMYYTESPELPAGQELQVESALEGFDSEITRTVIKDGEVIDEYVLTSSFAPSRNTILRGTGEG